MAKSSKRPKQFHKKSEGLTPAQTLSFFEDYSNMIHAKDERTHLISVRVPKNVLNAFKVKSRSENKKYQSVIVQLMREWAAFR